MNDLRSMEIKWYEWFYKDINRLYDKLKNDDRFMYNIEEWKSIFKDKIYKISNEIINE